jgi:hypothetical protein
MAVPLASSIFNGEMKKAAANVCEMDILYCKKYFQI